MTDSSNGKPTAETDGDASTTQAEPSSTRHSRDWIESFTVHTNNLPSPEIFRKWCGIGAVAAAAERRVFTSIRSMPPLYPNMFVLLVAPPGVGKSVAINASSYFQRQSGKVKIAAATMTKAALVDALKDARQTMMVDKQVVSYHSLSIPSPEFGNLVPAYETPIINLLNDLFDCRDDFIERTRGKGEIIITRPQINILGGTQPDYLSVLMPEAAWGMGFTSRIIMIYSDDKASSLRSLFSVHKPNKHHHEGLIADLKRIASLKGEFRWAPEAAKKIDEWHLAGGPPTPTIPRLDHYVTRRTIHMTKLMMISSLSRGDSLVIEGEDFDTALDWLIEAERTMPEIFRTMTSGGDSAIMTDTALWVREKELKLDIAIPKHRIIDFLRTRMKATDVMRVFDLMVASHLLAQKGLDASGQPTFTANVDLPAPPKPKPQADLFTPTPPSTGPDGATATRARYILRVTDAEADAQEEPDYDSQFYEAHS